MSVAYQGRHVVVTGGAGGLGSAVVDLLVEQGAVCYLPVRKPENGKFPKAPAGRVNMVSGVDLTDEASVEKFYAELPDLWASIHCAGAFAMAPVADTSLADFSKMWAINTAATFLSCRAAVKKFRNGGNGKGGRLVNVSARPALEGRAGAGMIAYTASKAGVAALTEALAEELASEGIWVNAVVPSVMNTEANRKAMPTADHSKWPTVEDVGRTIVFLASPQNGSTRGGIVPVYGRS